MILYGKNLLCPFYGQMSSLAITYNFMPCGNPCKYAYTVAMKLNNKIYDGLHKCRNTKVEKKTSSLVL